MFEGREADIKRLERVRSRKKVNWNIMEGVEKAYAKNFNNLNLHGKEGN